MERIEEITIAENTKNILAVNTNQVIVYNNNIYSYNLETKKMLWQHIPEKGEYNLYGCQLHGNLLYASFNHYRYGHADMHDQRLIIINTQSGEIIWKASIVSNSSFFCIDNHWVYCLNSEENKVYCFNTNKSEDNLLWQQKIKIQVDKKFKGEYYEGEKRFTPRIQSCFSWNSLLVITSDANQWFYLNTTTGAIERKIELTHKLIGKEQIYPIDDRPLVIHNNTATFIYRGILCRVNLDSGEAIAYITTFDGKQQDKMSSKKYFWGNYDRHVFLSDNKFYFDNDTTSPQSFFEIPVDSTDGIITHKVEYTTRLDYLHTKRVKVFGKYLFINKNQEIVYYHLQSGETNQIEGIYNDFVLIDKLLFMLTDHSVVVMELALE